MLTRSFLARNCCGRCGDGTSVTCQPSPCTSNGCARNLLNTSGFKRCGAAVTCGGAMHWLDLAEVVGWASGCSLPLVLLGWLVIWRARTRSLALSMVVLVLIPTLATIAGVLGASRFMITQTFQQTMVVMIIISLVTIPAAVTLARYQARRTVWERQIRDAERAAELSRRRLVAFVSHDLRTPLAGIRAVSEAIADGVVDQDEVRNQAKHIEQESIRLAAMVDDLFEMSKINAGAVQTPLDNVALDEVVDDVMAAHRIVAERAGVALRVVMPGEPIRVRG